MSKHRHHREEDEGTEASFTATPAAAESVHAQLQEELAAAKDRALRFQAEVDNYRKRAEREMAEERRYANLSLLRDLLPVLDNVYRAIEAAETSAGGEGLLAGVRMVAEQLENVLKRHHCIRIEADGVPFDPNLHEALAQQPSTEHAAGHVMAVALQGYVLYDRVVRPSQVIVSGGPPAAPAPAPSDDAAPSA